MVSPCKNKVVEKQNFGEFVEGYMNTHDFEKAVLGHCPVQHISFYPSPNSGDRQPQSKSHPLTPVSPQVASKLLVDHLPEPTAEEKGRPLLGLVPQSTMREFFLPITAFNIGRDTKNGCGMFKKSND